MTEPRTGTAKPIRIQRRRTKGWKMPENTVAVTRPTMFGNPFKVGCHYRRGVGAFTFIQSFKYEEGYTTIQTAEEAVGWFRWYIVRSVRKQEEVKTFLRGKNLACWCQIGQPCHADVLLEIANGD